MITASSSFVADPIEAPLVWLLRHLGFEDTVRMAAYHQVFQHLLTPGGPLDGAEADLSILLIRPEDYLRDQPTHTDLAALALTTTDELLRAAAQHMARVRNRLIVVLPPLAPAFPAALLHVLLQCRDRLREGLIALPRVSVLDDAALARVGVAGLTIHDPIRDELAHLPYTDACFAGMALAVARFVHTLRVPALKVLALDCDHTLWRGVVGEDGVEGIEVTGGFVALQQFAIAQQSRGVLICLLSKNAEADVADVFARHPGMVLKMGHVVSHRVNWLPKAVNMQALAQELNLGLDAFVFLDDNPVECGQMREQLPQVVTLQVPEEAAIQEWLDHLWMFDKAFVTAEDAQRTQMYRENSARRALESDVQDVGAFLAALQLRIDIAPPAEDEWARVSQLTLRTNQFNFTTRRRTVDELRQQEAEGAMVLRARVSDRFGDYGLVGVVVALKRANNLVVDSMMLSCRVLGRGVEHAMLRYLAQAAEAAGLSVLELHLLPTPRNEPAAAFIDSVAADYAATMAGGKAYRIPVAEALNITHRPGEDPDAVVNARLADERKSVGGGTSAASAGPALAMPRWECYELLSRDWTNGQALLAAMEAARDRTRVLDAPVTGPENGTQERLLAIWQSVLRQEGLGIDDNYFALGGTSLQSVQVFASIAGEFGVRLPLTTILQAPTVRELAVKLIDGPLADPAQQGLVVLRSGAARPLFLVHDGLGETLLYLNMARLLPADMGAYAIEPLRLPGVPMAHDSMESMARSYVERIRQVQPHGPYRLGGMCAGGVIAYQMAAELRQAGELVELVIVMDGAAPQAELRAGLAMKARVQRLRELVFRGQPGPLRLTVALMGMAGGFLNWQIRSHWSAVLTRVKFAKLSRVVRGHSAWPTWLPSLSVPEIYQRLEARYRPPVLSDVLVVLVRATEGRGSDAPYRDFYRDDDFGWRCVASGLSMVDVPGGHSSMLQEGHVDGLARALEPWLKQSARPTQAAV